MIARCAVVAAILAATAALCGCPVAAFIGQALFPPKVAAAYHLEDRLTVIVADDPTGLLDDRTLLRDIAHGVGLELLDHKVLTNVIPIDQVDKLERRMGDEFARLPIDRIGAEVGADQVLHVHVDQVMVSQTRLNLVCRVKVIDVARSVRVFPAVGGEAPSARAAGVVTTQMVHKPTTEMGRGSHVMLNKDLARRVSVDVARLFYKYEVPLRDEKYHSSQG